MSEIGFALALGIAALFAWAGVLKLASIRIFMGQLEDYELVPRSLLWPLGVLVPIAEIGGATLTIIPGTRPLGGAALLALLALFSAVTVRNLRHGRTDIRCACFGGRSQHLGWSVPVRNLMLAGPLLLGLSATDAQLTTAGVVGAGLAATVILVALEGMKVFERLGMAAHE